MPAGSVGSPRCGFAGVSGETIRRFGSWRKPGGPRHAEFSATGPGAPESGPRNRTIPGLEKAEFARLGGIHRNTYLNSPALLDGALRLKADPRLRFAGQITGVEGYVESAAIGLLAGRFAAAERLGRDLPPPPATTALGALIGHITGGHIADGEMHGPRSFQPMNVNFGLFPPLTEAVKHPDGKRLRGPEKARAKKMALSARAERDLARWLVGS